MIPPFRTFLLAGNRLLRESLARVLRKRGDISVVGAAAYTPQALEEMAGSGCEILLVDSFSPPWRSGATGLSDLQFVHEVVQRIPPLKVVMIGMEEDADTFLKAVRAGAVGYVLKDASAMDVVAAVRAVAQDEAACPPRLCLSLFKYVSREWNLVPNIRVKVRLGLTRRQQQLIPLVAQGLTNKEIASHLLLSEQTIKNHIHRMMQRVGAEDRLAIVEMVRMQGIFL